MLNRTTRRQARAPLTLIVWAVVAAAGGAARAEEEEQPAPRPAIGPGDEIVNFSLLDYRGKHYELRRTSARVVVLFFTGADCPIGMQNSAKLQRINEELG